MMKALFLNFASNNSSSDAEACMACVSDTETVAYAPMNHRMADHEVMPLLEDLLEKAGWTYQDLAHIACIVGPGGFTSLRMAVSLANVLADQLQIPVVGIHLSDVYRARVMMNYELGITNYEENPKHNSSIIIHNSFMWFHSTKKTDVFVRTFDVPDSPWTEPTLVSIESLRTQNSSPFTLPSTLQWSGELIPEHREALVSWNLQPSALAPLSETLPSFLASQTYTKELLQPWYGRGW